MADLVIVAIIGAFLALCLGYVAWCDRIIGPDELLVESTDVAATEQSAAEHSPSEHGLEAVTS